MTNYRFEVKCEDCDKIIGTTFSPKDTTDIKCLTCSEKLAKIQSNRDRNDLQPHYYCKACNECDAPLQSDILMHILDKHKEIQLGTTSKYIGVIQ